MAVQHVTGPVVQLGKKIPLLPIKDGELRAANGDVPASPAVIQRYLSNAFGEHLVEVSVTMEVLAARYEPAELNRIGFKLYEKFRPKIPPGNTG